MTLYNTRIMLKSDTEEKWKVIDTSFVPLLGEMIIYSADNTHSYSRVKIGDGNTTLKNLPFVDAGTINGKEIDIVKVESFSYLPSPGSPDKLYIDLSTQRIYHYDPYNGYLQLSNFSFNVSKTLASKITNWSAGVAPEMSVENNILTLKTGFAPILNYYNTEVVSNIQKE